MRALLLSILLLPAVAGAQAVYTPPMDWRPPSLNWTASAGSTSPSLWLPLSSTGAVLAEDAGTVSHVTFDGRHNLTRWSTDLSQADWLNFNSTDAAVPDQGDGYTWREVTETGATGSFYQTPTIYAATTRTAMVTARMPSGTGAAGVMMSCQSGTVSNCTCSRSDGGACAPVVSSGYQCSAEATGIGTTPVRIYATGTCATALTTSALAMFVGTVGDLAAYPAWFSRPQLTIGGPTEYVPTGSAARSSVPLDSKGITWTGDTVPAVQATSGPFTSKAGAGPYSAPNSFTGPTTVGEWAGDWSVTVVFTPTALGSFQILAAKQNAGSSQGWYCGLTSTGTLRTWQHDGAAKQSDTVAVATPNAINVATCGRTGGTLVARLNGASASAPSAAGVMTAATAEPVRLGYSGSGSPSTVTTIYEVLASTTPYSDALHLDRWRRAVGLYGSRQEVITLTRGTPRTCVVNGREWVVANDAPCVNGVGMLIERTATNLLLQSSTSCVANAVQTPWAVGTATCASDVAVAPDGTTTADRTTVSGARGGIYQTVTTASSTGPFTYSEWIKAESGTPYVASFCGVGTASACSCAKLEGDGTVTGTLSSGTCFCDLTGSTGWTRVASTVTCNTASTSPGGSAGIVTTGSLLRWGGQHEGIVSTATSRITPDNTTTATAARNVESPQLTVSATLVPDPSRWCIRSTATSYAGWYSPGRRQLWSWGVRSAVNTSGAYWNAGWYNPHTYGSSGNFYSYVAGSQTPVTSAAWSNGGAVGGSINGVPTTPGTGTAMTAQPTTLYLGADSAGETLDGYLRDLKIYRDARCGR